jgi:hypothetical protein
MGDIVSVNAYDSCYDVARSASTSEPKKPSGIPNGKPRIIKVASWRLAGSKPPTGLASVRDSARWFGFTQT